MSQDIISDALNKIMNAKRSGKKEVVVNRHSILLLKIMEMAKKEGYIESYKTEKNNLEIKIGDISNCGAVKPRFNVKKDKILFYMKRFLPARNLGILIISTNQGLITHVDAIDKNIGGSLIAYFY
ncbi:MAG TPA: 30S ribosomal protein S8 [Candidatus Nanoarchaeia archaeon]|nr:30S ribosomal protein S8 [Candidatus Nanoarchaeia archaeon]